MITRRSLLGLALGATMLTGMSSILSAAEAPVVLYSALDTAVPAAAAFQKKTGHEVKLVSLSTGELLGKIAAEGANPQFDLVWVEGSAVMRRMAGDGLLAPMADVAKAAPYTDMGKKLLTSDAMYLPTSMSGTAIIINTKKLPDAKIESWADLAALAGKVAAKDPNFSGPSFQWLAGIMQTNGEAAVKEMLPKILTVKKLSGIPSGGALNKALLTGDAAAGIQQDTNVYGLIDKGEAVRIVYPKDGVVALPASIGLNAKSKNADIAKQFVAYVLSAEGQAEMQSVDETDSFYAPIIVGVKAKGTRPDKTDWVLLDDAVAAKHEADWKKWYRDSFVP